MDREIRYIIICDSFDFFIYTHFSIFRLIYWIKGLRAIRGWLQGGWVRLGRGRDAVDDTGHNCTGHTKLKPHIFKYFY